MADPQEARVPDIGQDNVPVIEVMIKAGDRIEKEQSLITLESDKATMEVPAPFAGTVKEVKLKVGDEVSEGTVIAMVEAAETADKESAAGSTQKEAPATSGNGAERGEKKTSAASPAPAPAGKKKASGAVREAKVPDIGSEDVPVIEILVSVGDTVEKDQGLITLESDKATMEVPSSLAGVVRELKVKLGDTLSEGNVIALIEAGEEASLPADATAASATPQATAAKDPAQREARAAPRARRRPSRRNRTWKKSRRHSRARRSTPASSCRATRPTPARPSALSRASSAWISSRSRAVGPRRPDPARGRQRLCKACAGLRCAPGRRGIGIGRRPEPAAVAEGRLRQVRRDRGTAALPHPEDFRRQPGAQLGDDPARHPARRRRHHRAWRRSASSSARKTRS